MGAEQGHSAEASRTVRLLVGLVGAACRFPRTVLTLAALLVGLSLYLCATRLEYRTERSDLISPDKASQRRWQRYLDEFGEDNDMVLVVQGHDRERMVAAVEALAAKVRADPRHFDRLFYKVDLRPLRNRALLLLPRDQIAEIHRNLDGMRLLLEFGSAGWQSLGVQSLLAEARVRLGRLKPGEPLGPSDSQFFLQLTSVCNSAAATLEDPDTYRNPWTSLLSQPAGQKDLLAEPQYFLSGDGTLAFLLARPVKETGSFTAARQSVDLMRTLIVQTRPDFPDLQFGLTGLPVLETDEMVAAERDTRTASLLALGGVTLLFLIVYRGIYYPLLTVGTLLLGTCLAMGWATLTVGHLNILSATFAVMLIGMGDYGVLWVMRYERERRHGADVETALRSTAVCVGAGTLTAALTTVLAFYAAMLADFRGVSELGWIAGSGVLWCAFSCFTVLPAVLKLADRRRSLTPATLPLPSQSLWLPGVAGRSFWVVVGSVGLVSCFGLLALHVPYDHNLLHLQAADLDSVKWEQVLIEKTAGANWSALSHTASAGEALALKARYERLPEVSRVVEVASLVPYDQDKKLGLVSDIRHRLRHLPELGTRLPHPRLDPVALRRQSAELAALVEQRTHAVSAPVLIDLARAVSALHVQLPAEQADRAAARLQQFDERMAEDLAADLHRLRGVAAPERITLGDLPPALRERYVGENGRWLVQIFAKDCGWDFEPLERFTRQVQQVDPEATGKPFGTVEGLRAMKNGFERAGLYAFAAIVLVLRTDFRNWCHTLIGLSPLVMGLTAALGIMGLLGLPLNPANMIALPLVLGVGVDNGVHILHDFLADKAEGRFLVSRAIARGVLVKALTTLLGFGSLMVSSQPGLFGLGLCLTLGVGSCMLAALLFLPALLHLVSRRIASTEPRDGAIIRPRQAA